MSELRVMGDYSQAKNVRSQITTFPGQSAGNWLQLYAIWRFLLAVQLAAIALSAFFSSTVAARDRNSSVFCMVLKIVVS